SFINQPIFHSTNGHSMRLIEGLMRAKTQGTVRVAVLDTGFTPSNDVIYSDGYSFSDPIGPEFRNGMGGICSNMENPDLEKPHGIGVASVAAATPNNGIGMAGVSPNIELVAGRVGLCEGGAFISEITEGLLWAGGFPTRTGAPEIEPVYIVNISFGGVGACPAYLQTAIDMVTDRGVTVVIGAGNEGGDTA
ncbi:S8 family serine peptidase, partial [Priestia megaterium]|uniref:S8 family serine peptidase n=1 Tax=Priestia megaterium TaxID=1404 RepID=UPI0035B62CA7